MTAKANVAIYRHSILPVSETFVAAHAASMRRHVPHLFGVRRIPGTKVPVGVNCVTLGGHSKATRVQELAFLYCGYFGKILRFFEQVEPKLIHAHFALDGTEVLPLKKKLTIPLIVTLHGFDVTVRDTEFAKSRGGRRYLRNRPGLFESAALFICVSQWIRDQALDKGFPAEKLWIHYLGIDLQSFRHDPNVERENVVLFVARLVEKKGCIHLIRAMQNVQKTLPGVRLIVIGDGPERIKLQNAAESLDRVEFLGPQSAEVIRSWMNRSKVFCVPCVVAANGDSDGLGISFCEAQAMGLPTVSFDTGGVNEAVIHGQTGLLAPAGDHRLLGEYILNYLTDDSLWRSTSIAGRKRMESHFDLRKQTAALEGKYIELTSVR